MTAWRTDRPPIGAKIFAEIATQKRKYFVNCFIDTEGGLFASLHGYEMTWPIDDITRWCLLSDALDAIDMHEPEREFKSIKCQRCGTSGHPQLWESPFGVLFCLDCTEKKEK